jgi:hypothetical protein
MGYYPQRGSVLIGQPPFQNIGMTAPPMTREIGFASGHHPTEADMMMGMGHHHLHAGPMLALQRQQIPPHM